MGGRAYTPEYFWSRRVVTEAACWEWTGPRHDYGYGITKVDGHRVYAHRQAYILTYGPIPDGFFVCHHCDNPPCFNPEHLFAAEPRDNTLDSLHKGRFTTGERQPIAKLTRGEAAVIRQRIATREYGIQRRLAREYGVSETVIGLIKRGRIWKPDQTYVETGVR